MAANKSSEFGALIRRIKTENGWSLAEMEEAGGYAVGPTYYSTMMGGQIPTRDTLQRITDGPGFRKYAREMWDASGYRMPGEFRPERPSCCDLARSLADQTGQPKEDVIREALEHYAARISEAGA